MRLVPPLLTLALTLTPALAQERKEDDGFNLMEEGARLFLRGMMREMEPALEDLRGLAEEMRPAMRAFADTMGPAFADLIERLDDIRNYEAPVILPNGDILIRRRPDAPPYQAPQAEPPARIDL